VNKRSFWLSALIAGAVLGVVGSLPVLNLVNCILCIYVWLTGALAIIFYRRYEKGQMTLSMGQAAGLGAVAGLFGAVFGALIYLLTGWLSTPIFNSLARALQVGDLPFRSGGIAELLITTSVFFVLDLVLYPLFGALGAMIAASFMKRPAAAG
jgi:hypothetical protein